MNVEQLIKALATLPADFEVCVGGAPIQTVFARLEDRMVALEDSVDVEDDLIPIIEHVVYSAGPR